MSTRARLTGTAVVATAALATLLSSPPVAAADGLPLGVDARPVSAPGSDVAYITRRAGRRTALELIDADSERRLRRVLLPGILTVPAVAYDATPSGLTPDGRKLVLIQPRRAFPRTGTKLAVVDTRRLRIRRTVVLRGDFSFDAISPDGRTMYLIRYLSPRDPKRYEVRAYDLRTDRLLPDPIVDPREPDERMNGQPVTRATGPGGRWEYTLYDGGEHPFVHALDTERGRAFCIDLHLRGGGLWGARLELTGGGGTLAIVMGAKRLASIDTRSFEVAGLPTPPTRRAAADRGPRVPWALVALPTLLLLGAAGALTVRLGRQRQVGRRTLGRARDAAGGTLERTR
jgi:hypothetical protein